MKQALPEGFTHEAITPSNSVVPYITVIRTCDGGPIGKQFFIDGDGPIDKKPAINHGVMHATVHSCATPSDYLKIQEKLGTDEAIILGVPSGCSSDEKFMIMGVKSLQTTLGWATEGDEVEVPFGWFDHEGVRIVCRLKDQWLYSTTRLFDLDAPDGTPEEFLYPSFDAWLADVGRGVPQLLNCELLVTQSSTGRVMGDTTKIHVIYTIPPETNIPQLAEDILINCWQNDLGWQRLRADTGSTMFVPIYDRTVMVGSQRIVYDGMPAVNDGIPMDDKLRFIQINIGGGDLDVGAMPEITQSTRDSFHKAGGTSSGGSKYATAWIDENEMFVTQSHGEMSLKMYKEIYAGEHVRCQIHQRGSTTMNGYFGQYDDGMAFVYDNGDHVLYQSKFRPLSETVGKLTKKTLKALSKAFNKISGTSKTAVPSSGGPMATLTEFKEKYILIARGSLVADVDRPGVDALTMAEFRILHANNRIAGTTPSGAPKMIPITELWLTDVNRKAVSEQDFDPQMPVMFARQNGSIVFNTWQAIPAPPGVGDAHGTNANLFRAHMEHLIPDPAERLYFMQFLAHTIQKPGERPAVAPILTTFEKGTGRGFIKTVMDRLLGDYSQTVSFTALLESQFNPFMFKSLMVTCEEVHMDKSPAKRDSNSNKLRDMVTANDMTINIKGVSQFKAKCFTRHVLHTNFGDAISMDVNERRFMVIQCCAIKMPNSDLMFDLLKTNPQFLADMYAMFMAEDISSFNPHTAAVVTKAMKIMVETADSQQMQIIKDVIRSWPADIVRVNDILIEARKKTGEMEEHTITGNLVAGALKEVGAEFRKIGWRDNDGVSHNVRVWIMRNQATYGTLTGKQIAEEMALTDKNKKVPAKVVPFFNGPDEKGDE